MSETIRLDKYLADMGCGTRSEVKQMIRKGQVEVNGEKGEKAGIEDHHRAGPRVRGGKRNLL